CGPAGMFAALRLIELGIKPIVLERGKDVRARRHDIAAIQRHGSVDPDSNYCFGEGGAGTYSDGKLYTRATKRGNVDAVLRTLVAHGAPPDILIDAHPHIGSNRLPKVVTALRDSILQAGGEIHFATRVTDFVIDPRRRLRGVITAAGEEVIADAVILATGHSARDIFTLLVTSGIRIEAKPLAMGVRVEHPQPLIDRIQYHGVPDPRLPAASYRLATTVDERGVFSFCMCPGGFIVPAATQQDEVVVNGMSLSRHDSPFANSGIVVSIDAADLEAYRVHGALAGTHYQHALETAAATAGGGHQRAPAQRLTDFLAGRDSVTLPATSYHPGITAAPLHTLLPESLVHRLQE
ncbi:MAG: NAD(P)/FAD-dependent oxidoreductase, partial [Gaiellaceae bacterium]